MFEVRYGDGSDVTPQELAEFYGRLGHDIEAGPQQISGMVTGSAAFVTARVGDRMVGVARGVSDGVRGYLTECKLDAQCQGPAAVTRTDGRVEHDEHGIAAEMARRVLERLNQQGVRRVDVLAWGTEVDFLEELGFRRQGGLVGLTLRPGSLAGVGAAAGAVRSGG